MEDAIAQVSRLPLLPARHRMHLMAKAAVMIY